MFVPENELEIVKNDIINITDYDNTTIKTFTNEYDTETINKYINEKRILMIEGIYPGVGKSTLAKNYDKDAVFVCPYNKLRMTEFKELYKVDIKEYHKQYQKNIIKNLKNILSNMQYNTK